MYLQKITSIESKNEKIKGIIEDINSGNTELKNAVKIAVDSSDIFKRIRRDIQKLRSDINLEVDYDLLKATERQLLIKNAGINLIIFILISVFVYAGVFFFDKKRSERKFEDRFWLIVKNYILNNSGDIKKLNINDRFQSELINCRSYYNKRLSFGSLFQESIPIPAAVFAQNDSNIWCNEGFIELFKETINCDQIQNWSQFTKLTKIDHQQHQKLQKTEIQLEKKSFK